MRSIIPSISVYSFCSFSITTNRRLPYWKVQNYVIFSNYRILNIRYIIPRLWVCLSMDSKKSPSSGSIWSENIFDYRKKISSCTLKYIGSKLIRMTLSIPFNDKLFPISSNYSYQTSNKNTKLIIKNWK